MRRLRPPERKELTALQVAVRCRPLTAVERLKCTEIIRIVDDKVVVVSDINGTKDTPDRAQSRNRERRYTFDHALGPEYRNEDVYNRTVASMIKGVVQGLNATIFAYGATGSGKTYTMSGTTEDPGLMVLSLQDIFHLVSKEEMEYDFEVTCSYLEVYNEVIYDLLDKSSGHLDLREDPEQGIIVAGLKRIQVKSADNILDLLHVGNSRRRTEKTDANFTSSRSHSVLEIIVKKYCRSHLQSQVLQGKVALVDLAGSERASETNSAGQKLRDGANINKSLLALANCINALGKQQKKGLAYVPYRNSKLTRILKDGLSGNSRTTMIATVSFSDDQCYHTINTLKYADRAKEIKTHVQKNIGTKDSHVADYQRMINNLQVEVSFLRNELTEKKSQLSGLCTGKMQDDELSWLDVLSRDISDNVEDRINLQKALFELEDKNLHNRGDLQQLDDLIAKHQMDKDTRIAEAFSERRKLILDNIRDNDEAGAQYRQEIEQNEIQRKDLQCIIDKAVSSDGSTTYLRILSQYRLLGMTNTELQFQIAVRDQIIDNQREVLSNLWAVLKDSGLEEKHILELASRQGITIEDCRTPSQITFRTYRGDLFSRDWLKSTSCETCKTLGLSQLTSLASRYHECTNNNMWCLDCRKIGIQMDYLKCEHQGFYSGRMENNYLASSLFHTMKARGCLPSWSSCGIINDVDLAYSGISSKMRMALQAQESLPKPTCSTCLESRENARVLLSEANSGLKEAIHADKKRQSLHSNVLHCCCSSTSNSCETQMKSVNLHDMREIDCCRNKCTTNDSCGFQKPYVQDKEVVRVHTQQSKLRGQLCN